MSDDWLLFTSVHLHFFKFKYYTFQQQIYKSPDTISFGVPGSQP